eukprot:TRINITY_DN94524_c0_g1_i1.p1 TRINITY_DN94524_c0_g1~~TRINITY_DN94524_c0_g1_i1.p1  ORF type:complete len:744 (+),score=120.99 TRINITY_DN94524_c0_g1_i1:25-2256(+)
MTSSEDVRLPCGCSAATCGWYSLTRQELLCVRCGLDDYLKDDLTRVSQLTSTANRLADAGIAALEGKQAAAAELAQRLEQAPAHCGEVPQEIRVSFEQARRGIADAETHMLKETQAIIDTVQYRRQAARAALQRCTEGVGRALSEARAARQVSGNDAQNGDCRAAVASLPAMRSAGLEPLVAGDPEVELRPVAFRPVPAAALAALEALAQEEDQLNRTYSQTSDGEPNSGTHNPSSALVGGVVIPWPRPNAVRDGLASTGAELRPAFVPHVLLTRCPEHAPDAFRYFHLPTGRRMCAQCVLARAVPPDERIELEKAVPAVKHRVAQLARGLRDAAQPYELACAQLDEKLAEVLGLGQQQIAAAEAEFQRRVAEAAKHFAEARRTVVQQMLHFSGEATASAVTATAAMRRVLPALAAAEHLAELEDAPSVLDAASDVMASLRDAHDAVSITAGGNPVVPAVPLGLMLAGSGAMQPLHLPYQGQGYGFGAVYTQSLSAICATDGAAPQSVFRVRPSTGERLSDVVLPFPLTTNFLAGDTSGAVAFVSCDTNHARLDLITGEARSVASSSQPALPYSGGAVQNGVYYVFNTSKQLMAYRDSTTEGGWEEGIATSPADYPAVYASRTQPNILYFYGGPLVRFDLTTRIATPIEGVAPGCGTMTTGKLGGTGFATGNCNDYLWVYNEATQRVATVPVGQANTMANYNQYIVWDEPAKLLYFARGQGNGVVANEWVSWALLPQLLAQTL